MFDIKALSDAGLLSLYDAITTALEFDEGQPEGQAKKHGVRQYGDWKSWANTLEAEIRRRGLKYTPIPW